MIAIGVHEAKTNLSELLRRVVQAHVHGIPIITADDPIAQYDVEVLRPDADR